MLVRRITLLVLALLQSHLHGQVYGLRPSQFGSGSGPDLTPPKTASGYHPQQNQQQYQQQQYPPQPTDPNTLNPENYESSFGSSPIIDNFENESVESRHAAWRAAQQRKYETQTPIDAANPRDEEGRMKLLASVSRGSISLFFFILMWRSVHHFELADQSFQKAPKTRVLLVLPTILMFVGNMSGCVAAIVSNQTKASKKRMKAVLNLNKLVELVLFVYNVLRLTLFPNKFVMREIYVGRTLSNFLFMVQCQLFTKVTWDAPPVRHVPVDTTFEEEQPYGMGSPASTSPGGDPSSPYYHNYGQEQGGYSYGNDGGGGGSRNRDGIDDGYGQGY